jgi:RimJ/RimL family protein N-acetyltransferase
VTLESFSTARLDAERLTADHWADLRRTDQSKQFMAYLGGVRDEAGTERYLDWNLAHWLEHGFGLWMLRERETGVMAGLSVLRHLEVDGIDEVEIGYGLLPEFWGRGLATVMLKIGLGYEKEIVHDGRLHLLFRSRFG